MLLIRTDASAKVGTGHVMRCLALAQAWQSAGGHVAFLMADSSPTLETRLRAEDFEVIHHPHPQGDQSDSSHTVALAKVLHAERVVVDGYHFGAAYQRHLKSAGLKVLFIDDNGHAGHYAADWVLNQNIHAHEGLYSDREPYTQLLLGTRYALIRREFWPWRGWQRQIPQIARKILVTLGGSDPDNVTLKVMQALQQVTVSDLEVIVVIGGSNPYLATLQAAAESASVKFDLHWNVTNMADLLAWADVAISGGGSTCWELAFMGIPSFTFILAGNQRAICKNLDVIGAVVKVFSSQSATTQDIKDSVSNTLCSYDLRKLVHDNCIKIVDGYGAQRIAEKVKI